MINGKYNMNYFSHAFKVIKNLGHSCPDFHRDKLQQESRFFPFSIVNCSLTIANFTLIIFKGGNIWVSRNLEEKALRP